MGLMLQSPPRLASLALRMIAPVRSASDATVPTYDAGGGVVEFNWIRGQFLDGGAHTFNIDSNGGFTLVAVVMFTEVVGIEELVLALGNSIVLSRYSTENYLTFVVTEPGTSAFDCTLWSGGGSIVQGQWARIAASYTRSADGSGGSLRLQVGESVQTRLCEPARSDRRENSSTMGLALDPSHDLFNGKVAGLFVVDAVLGADVIAELLEGMASGVGGNPLDACAACAESD